MGGNAEVRNAVDSAVEAALARLKGELVASIVDSLPEPPPPVAAAAVAPVAAEGGLDQFRTELFEVLAGSGQVELLNRLMGAIATHWDRAVLYLVKGTDFQPWAAQGFAAGVGDAAAKSLVVAGSKDTLLSVALTGSGVGSDNRVLANGLGAPTGLAAAVPLGIRGKAAAVLYVDGPKGSEDDSVAALELLARLTAASIELGMLTKRSDPGVRTRAATADLGGALPAAAAPSLSFEAPADEPEIEIEPKPEPSTSWGVAAPPTPAPAVPTPARAVPTPAPVSATPAPAAPSPPAVPAPAPVGAEMAAAKASAVVGAGQSLEPAKKYSRWKPVREQIEEGEPEDVSLAAFPEDERPKHVEAKKLARILVAEIKLYNEAKVAVGKKNKDLYERLKDDIERSRATYNDRVAKVVAGRVDYFKQELVASLADGDASALGM